AGLALLWPWRRSAATVLIQPLDWEPPYAMGVWELYPQGTPTPQVRSFHSPGAAGTAHNVEGEVQLFAEPTGALGKGTDLLQDNSLRVSMVIADNRGMALNMEHAGLSCSQAPNIILQLRGPKPTHTLSTLSSSHLPRPEQGAPFNLS
uniref:Uncharacterized protein n=2 Tax=Sus scrofa TaxID=9823 RepID=A0A5G2RGT7_PIG